MFDGGFTLFWIGLKCRIGIGQVSSITSGSIRHYLSGFHLAPSRSKFVINPPSFGCSVISSAIFERGIKSNSNLSIGASLAFLLNLYSKEVVNPVG